MTNTGPKIISMLEKEKRLPVAVTENSHLYIDLGFESLSYVDFLLSVEEAFGIDIDIAEMDACLLVNKLTALVEHKLGERNEHD